MKKITALFKKARALVTRSRFMHYFDVFAGAFVVALVANKQHILGAHGYNAWKSVVEAAAVVGGKATFEMWRKATPLPAPVAALLDEATAVASTPAGTKS